MHKPGGETQTLSIGDNDDDDRHGKKGKANSRYAVQVATVSSAANAEKLRAAASRKGYSAVVHSVGSAKKPQYRVRVEGLASRGAADQAAASLRKSGAGVKPIVIGND